MVLAFHKQDGCQQTQSKQLEQKTGTKICHQPENLISGFFSLTVGSLSLCPFSSRTAGRPNPVDLSLASGERGIRITPAAHPKLENEQRPQPVAVVKSTFQMLLNELLDGLRVKKTARLGRLVG